MGFLFSLPLLQSFFSPVIKGGVFCWAMGSFIWHSFTQIWVFLGENGMEQSLGSSTWFFSEWSKSVSGFGDLSLKPGPTSTHGKNSGWGQAAPSASASARGFCPSWRCHGLGLHHWLQMLPLLRAASSVIWVPDGNSTPGYKSRIKSRKCSYFKAPSLPSLSHISLRCFCALLDDVSIFNKNKPKPIQLYIKNYLQTQHKPEARPQMSWALKGSAGIQHLY